MSEQKITEVIFNKGTLMDLDIGRWTGRKKLVADDVLLSDINEDVLQLGNKKMLPKVALEPLITIERQARTTLASKSLAFPLSGARFVHYQVLPMILAKLKALSVEWEEAVEKLIQTYPTLRHQQLELLDKQNIELMKKEIEKTDPAKQKVRSAELETWCAQQRAANEELYPTDIELRLKFRFLWRTYKISALDGAEAMSTLQEDEIQAAQEALKSDMQKWVKVAAKEMHLALGGACKQAKELMEKQGKLNPKNLKPLFDAFETFKAIDFTGASDFQKVVDDIKKHFGKKKPDGTYDFATTAEGINATSVAQDEFKKMLETMSGLAVEDVADKAGLDAIGKVGEFKRVLEE